MVSSSKILTVSYGTFSCTAEGFEDPLGVVKDTTQFFRGVVREDRFFGAEPPQFDPELAAQLLQAQLDAEAQGGRLVLRGPLADVAAPVSQASAPASAPDVSRPAPPRPTAEVIGPDADRGMEAALAETAARAAAEAEAEAAAAQATESEIADAEAEVAHSRTGSLAAEAAFFAAEAGQAAGDEYDYEDSAFEVSAAPAPRAAPHEAAQDEAADSVAAKLRRIRAVVSGGAAASALAAENEADQDDSAQQDGADTVAAVSAMLGSLASEETASAAPDAGVAEDRLAACLIDEATSPGENDIIAEPEAESAPAPLALTPEFAAKPEAPAESPSESQPAEQRRSPRRVRVVKVTRAAFDAAVASGQLEQMDEPKPSSSLSAEDEAELARELEAVKAELAAGLESEWDEVEDLETLAAAPSAEIPLEAEQVLADLETEAAEDDSEDFAWGDEDRDDEERQDEVRDEENWDDEALDDTDWDFEAAEPDDHVKGTAGADVAEYDDEDEDDHGAEDAAAFATAFDEAPDAQDAGQQEDALEDAFARMAHEDVRKAVKLSSPARVMLTEQSVEDNDTSRILDETNTQMEEPEGNRRRSAIAHLRAAVAATRADRLLGRKKDAEAQAQPYREDLADVVRPRRPAAPSRAERPDAPSVETAIESRPAPLKLVAEQRVNVASEAAATPLRPRRVTLADVGTADAGGSDFADYADSVGAHDLPELLEAAAAYLSYVEGHAQFSRPQLMTKVRQVEGQDSSREDRLRSFGQLLRDGKIEKTGGGRFTVSERISFKPSTRAVG